MEEGSIVDVGRTSDIIRKYSSDDVIDAHDNIVMPGLVNSHNHIFQTIMRCVADETFNVSVGDVIFPLSRELHKRETKISTLLACLEMIRTGTSFIRDDHYVHTDKESIFGVAEAIDESGMRASIGRGGIDSEFIPKDFREDAKTMKSEFSRFFHNWNGKANGRIQVRPEAQSEKFSSPEMFQTVRELATKFKTGMCIHIAESLPKVLYMRERYGMSSVEFLNHLGVLGSDVMLDHCVWMTDTEIKILKLTGTSVSHQPLSNQSAGDGVAPVARLLKEGVVVAIGTDGAITNNLDMFDAMRACALLCKVTALDPTAISAQKVLEMATIDGARALGISESIGSIEKGKKADIIVVNRRRPDMVPSIRLESNLVYSASGYAVDTVIVDGEKIMSEGRVLTIDEEKVMDQAQTAADSIMEKSKLSELPKQKSSVSRNRVRR